MSDKILTFLSSIKSARFLLSQLLPFFFSDCLKRKEIFDVSFTKPVTSHFSHSFSAPLPEGVHTFAYLWRENIFLDSYLGPYAG